MIEYIEQDIENDIEKISKINLIEHFVKNINDNKNQELYVELCYTYATSELCRKVKDIEYFHSKIEKIYQSDTGKSEDIAYFYDEISKKMKEFSIDESIDKSIELTIKKMSMRIILIIILIMVLKNNINQ